MKLRLGDLEEARKNPNDFVQGSVSKRTFSSGMTKNRALQYAIYEFHKQGLDRALEHFEYLYTRHWQEDKKFHQLRNQLELYAVAYDTYGWVNVQTKLNVLIPIGELQLTGEIPRFDLATDGGYEVWLFAKTSYDWKNELRMPIIQAHFAQRMHVGNADVAVGMYCMDSGQHEIAQYSDNDIRQASKEVIDLATLLIPPQR